MYKRGALIITSSKKCWNTCTFCDGIGSGKSLEQEFKDAIENAKYFINNGYDEIEISGVDPSECPFLPEIIFFLKKNGIGNIIVSSHGRGFKDENFVHRLKKSGLEQVRIPLYGSNEKIHNSVTQAKSDSIGNAFSDTIIGIKNIIKYSIGLTGNIPITYYNVSDIRNTISLYKRLAKDFLDMIYISPIFLTEMREEYTKDWYMPINKMKDYLDLDLNDDKIVIPDIPYCVFGKYVENVENTFEVPDLGEQTVPKYLESQISNKIPHHRIKTYFSECEECELKGICAGTSKNDLEMFGSGNLKAIKR